MNLYLKRNAFRSLGLKTFCLLALLPFSGFALEAQPWFGDVFEFHFLGSYAYSYFNRVQNGVPQLTNQFNSHVGSLSLDFSPSPEWSIDSEIRFAETSAMSFNFRSGAIQARYLWLDDIIGDPVSLATGFNVRLTNHASLRDVSCMSHATADFEAHFSIGKEYDASESWRFRTWGFGAVGHANLGSPWVRAIIAIETNIEDEHKFAIYAEGMNGYGRHVHVHTDNFNGYAKIRQKSIDIGFRYGLRIGVWGTLRAEYVRRILAKSCPQVVNTFMFSYLLPFSL